MFDFGPFPVIETERLKLREIKDFDAQAIYAIRSDYEVTRYNIGAAYTDLQQAHKLIAGMQTEYKQKSALRWGITLRDEGTVIGMCGFNYWNRTDHRASIGYDLARQYWSQGIMSETLRAVINFGFNQMRLNRIEADTSIYNHASIYVLKKLGFKKEGHQREQYYENGKYHDLLLFALLQRDYYNLA